MKEPLVKKKKILLIGGEGQLGSDLKGVLGNYELIVPSRAELDISYFDQAKNFINNILPDVIINTAAFHQPEECEKDPQKSFLINTLAIKNLAEISKEKNIPLVHISTDYVFGLDENRSTPYTEEDLPGPVNIYGISKLSGEYCIQYTTSKFFIIRTSALFGVAGCRAKGGSNFVEMMLKLAREKGEARVKNDEWISPTYTKELAQNIAKLIETDYYGLYHITNQGECSWYEFAQKIFELTNIQVKCLGVPSSEFPSPIKRPRYSVLDNKHLREKGLDTMSHWEIALKNYLKEKGYINF